MTNYYVESCAWQEAMTFDSYVRGLSAPVDSFLEDHILESSFYRIVTAQQVEVGCFAVHKGSMLTLFYLIESVRRHGPALFARVLHEHGVEATLVPTCDELLLSHALRHHSKVTIQALFFVGGEPTQPANDAPQVSFRPATTEDIPTMAAIDQEIVDDPAQRVAAGQVYVGWLADKMVSVGLAIPSRLWPQQASLGMFTRTDYRRCGLGTEAIRYLMGVCQQQGLTALAGCGYGHDASRATLQAAGMVPATRLLRISF